MHNTKSANKYLYNGKELQDHTGYYDYGFRQLDPALGRWFVQDALAEKYKSVSAYAYTLNDPINHTDLLGLLPNTTFHWWGGSLAQDGHLVGGGGNLAAFLNSGPSMNEVGPTGEDYDEFISMGGDCSSFSEWYSEREKGISGFYTHLDGNIIRLYLYGIGSFSFKDGVPIARIFDNGNINFNGIPRYLKNFTSENAMRSSNRGESDSFSSDGIWTLGITGTAAAGIIGASAEIGLTLDFRNNFSIGGYFTLEHASGADASVGLVLNYHKPKSNTGKFGVSNLKGWAESYDGGLFIVDGKYGGEAIYKGFNLNNYPEIGEKTYDSYGIGISYGLPAGFTIHKGYTWIYSF